MKGVFPHFPDPNNSWVWTRADLDIPKTMATGAASRNRTLSNNSMSIVAPNLFLFIVAMGWPAAIVSARFLLLCTAHLKAQPIIRVLCPFLGYCLTNCIFLSPPEFYLNGLGYNTVDIVLVVFYGDYIIGKTKELGNFIYCFLFIFTL